MTDIIISKEIQFDAGHRVPGHGGKCKNPHGHRYRVIVSCNGSIIDDPSREDDGMLVDFGDLKQIMMANIHEVLDHKFIVYEKDEPMQQALAAFADFDERSVYTFAYRFPVIPTAENIAVWCWNQIKDQINQYFNEDLTLFSVQVYETPTSEATFYG